jgi:hypothetical protein
MLMHVQQAWQDCLSGKIDDLSRRLGNLPFLTRGSDLVAI